MRAFDPVVIGTGFGGQSHFRAGITETSASEAGSTPSLAAAAPDFNPNVDTIGVVSIQDGPTIGSGKMIAPEAKALMERSQLFPGPGSLSATRRKTWQTITSAH